MGILKTVWRCCGCSTEERQKTENVDVVPSVPLPQREEVLLHAPNVEGVPLIHLLHCEPPRFDRSEQVVLDRNGANDAFLNPLRRDKVFAFVIDKTASNIANYLRDSLRFPQLTYFRLELYDSYSHAHGRHLYLSEFLQQHRDTLTFLDVAYEAIDGSPAEEIFNELRQAVPHLEQLTTLRIPGSDEMIDLFQWTLPELRCLEITFTKGNHNGFTVLAPNLETFFLVDNRGKGYGRNTVDLSNCPNLAKASFLASKERKLILPTRGSQVKWLELGSTVNVTGDLSQLVVLEIHDCRDVDVNPLLDLCKSSLRELCIMTGGNAVIDASIGLNVLRLSNVKNARVITTASAPLELLTVWESNFSENHEPLYAKRVWLTSLHDDPRVINLRLMGTAYFGAHGSGRWISDLEAVIRGVASTLKVLAISPMLELPSFPTLEYVCLPTAADFIKVKERLGSQLKGIAITSELSETALQQVRDTVCPNIERIRPTGQRISAEFGLDKTLYNYLTSHAIYVTNTGTHYDYM